MGNQPIDDLNSIQPDYQKGDPVVKTVAGALCIILLVFSFLCFKDVVEWITGYFSYRYKWVVGFELHSISLAISMPGIPLTAYAIWLRRFKKRGFISYLVLLAVMVILFVAFYVVGLELLFSLPKTGIQVNPLLPSYSVFSPFRFYFDLLFMLSVILPFLLLQVAIKRKKIQ